MANVFKLTRKEISKFAQGDQRIIKFIENLNTTEASIEISDIEGAIATARASEASGMAQDALNIAKNAKVLLWLSI